MARWSVVLCVCACLRVRAERKSVSHSDFYFDSKDSTYVDKTLFIGDVLQDWGEKLVLTAPRGFGKTTNLHALKAFLQLEVDKFGKRMTAVASGSDKPIRDTPNYKLFRQKRVAEDVPLMDRHFGRSPVVHVDLKSVVRLLYFNETQDFFKDVLHEAFLEHKYLEESDKLYEEERSLVRLWCSRDAYQREDMGTLTPGLHALAKLLFKHFERTRVVVLVDHYDSPLFNCLVDAEVPTDVFRYVLNVVQALFDVKKDDFYVATYVVTGTSQVKEAHSASDKPVRRYAFLDDHRFAQHYGLTEDELFDLLGRYTISVDGGVHESVMAQYGGYRSMVQNASSLTNPWATLQYLRSQKLDHVWARVCDLPSLPALLGRGGGPDVRAKVESLLRGVPVAMDLNRFSTHDGLHILRALLADPAGPDRHHLLYSCLLFSLLFEHGFLSYDPEIRSAVSDTRRYFLPNQEVKEFLWAAVDQSPPTP